MNPGTLDRRIALYGIADSRSESGESVPVRNLIATIPAGFSPSRASRGPSDGVQSRVQDVSIFYIRWLSLLAPGRVVTSYEIDLLSADAPAVTYRIMSAVEIGPRRSMMQIDCETVNEAKR